MRYSIVFTLLTVSLTCWSQKIELQSITSELSDLVDIITVDAEQMLAVQKTGEVYSLPIDGSAPPSLYVDISDRVVVGGERGLLGLAVHPDYNSNGYVYLHYTGSGTVSTLSRFEEVNGTLDPDSEFIILTQSQPFNNHNAGAIHFGPDGYLYIPFGDGGSAEDPGNRSQNPQTWLGKMLRIDVNGGAPYTVPADNPFVDSSDTLPEIWSIGLRNPWKFSFDMLTGDMYIADVGQYDWEEVSYQPSESAGGENYGWKCQEGFEVFDPNACGDDITYTSPIHVYANNQNQDGCSITGGYVHRNMDEPYLYGKYIYGDYCSGKIWALSVDDCGQWHNEELLEVQNFNLSTFGQDQDGSVYVGLYNGRIQKITPVCALQVSLIVQDETCAGSADGSLTVESNSTTYSLTIDAADANSLAAGTYTVLISDENGCEVSECISVAAGETLHVPDITVFDPQITLCEGEVSTLTGPGMAPAGLQYVIYRDSIPVLTATSLEGLELEGGIYNIAYTDGTCISDAVPFIEVVLVPKQDIEIMPFGETISATAGFIAYQWFSNGELLPSEISQVLSTFVVGDSYTVLGIDELGCSTNMSEAFTATNIDNLLVTMKYSLQHNPVTDRLVVLSDSGISAGTQYTIYDMTGKALTTATISRPVDRLVIPSAALIPGSYILILNSQSGAETLQFVKGL